MSRRPYGPADDDAPWDCDDAPPCSDQPAEPTLRELAVGALQAAHFRVVRDWPIDYLDGRTPMLGEVMLGGPRDADGYEVCALQWWGNAKGAAMAQHRGAFEAARVALAAVGLYAVSDGGLRMEVGWQGTPDGWIARAAQVRAERVAA